MASSILADGLRWHRAMTSYPVVLPKLGDARLHVAMVVMTIHVLGQVGLGFRVSVPQIAAAIVPCALIELAIQFRRQRAIVWPASAMLTGSGVALILRDNDTSAGEPFATNNLWLFSAVAVGSLATKYLIRMNGSHVFNPSNIGLVVAFVLLGSDRIEPLDFWWAPLGGWMIAAYAVILLGGVAITRRGDLLPMAVAFWVTLALLLGVLAVGGHCMATPWSSAPVCDEHFWWVVVTSPETMVFLFFMITDPRTVPSGRRGRVGFAVAVAVVSALLMAPQTTEFGAKVGLLGGLVVVCAARPLVESVVRVASSTGGLAASPLRAATAATRFATAVVVLVTASAGVTLSGAAAREPAPTTVVKVAVDPTTIVPFVDPARVPDVHVGDGVRDWFGDELDPQAVGVELVRILDVEAVAVERGDVTLLDSVDHGERLTELRTIIEAAPDGGVPLHYRFDTMALEVIVVAGQGNLTLGVAATGQRYNSEPGDSESGDSEPGGSEPFAATFGLRQGGVDRWFLVDVSDGGG